MEAPLNIGTPVVSIDEIKAPHLRDLAKDLFEILSPDKRFARFEIEGEDLYFQLGEGDSFLFSVEVRGDDAEFFFGEFNFILAKEGDFSNYHQDILVAAKAILEDKVTNEIFKIRRTLVKSVLVFDRSLEVKLYEIAGYGLLRSWIGKHLKKSLKKVTIQTKPLLTH